MALQLFFDACRFLRSARAGVYRTGEVLHLEGSPLAASAHNHNTLRTPLVDLAEWHLLLLVMFLNVLHDLHCYWPPLLAPTGASLIGSGIRWWIGPSIPIL